MPMTYAQHEKKLKAPAVCELLPLRDLPVGDNVMVRTNGAFVAGYELRGILAYFATDGDRNQTASGAIYVFDRQRDDCEIATYQREGVRGVSQEPQIWVPSPENRALCRSRPTIS